MGEELREESIRAGNPDFMNFLEAVSPGGTDAIHLRSEP